MSHRVKCPISGCKKYIRIDNPRDLDHLNVHTLMCDDCEETHRQWAKQRATELARKEPFFIRSAV